MWQHFWKTAPSWHTPELDAACKVLIAEAELAIIFRKYCDSCDELRVYQRKFTVAYEEWEKVKGPDAK